MKRYRFITGEAQIWDTPHVLNTLGQAVELDDALACNACIAGAAILPEADFEALGFTVEEMAAYPNPRLQAEAPPDFQAKLKAALVRLHDYRESLRGEGVR